jgi:hypothetical protein
MDPHPASDHGHGQAHGLAPSSFAGAAAHAPHESVPAASPADAADLTGPGWAAAWIDLGGEG